MLIRPTIFKDLPGIIAAFSTRKGGVSNHEFDSLNVGFNTADDPSNTKNNRAILFGLAGGSKNANNSLSEENAAFAGLIHGTKVQTVTKAGWYAQTDGLVTTQKNLVLGITAADCASVLFADPIAGVIGACHAGWRGTVAGIVDETVKVMISAGGSVKNMRAWVSPCIGVNKFEVGPEVANQFPSQFVYSQQNSNPYVDLKAYLGQLLLDAGLSPAYIQIDPTCTASNLDLYFSHRAESGKTGRMMGIISQK